MVSTSVNSFYFIPHDKAMAHFQSNHRPSISLKARSGNRNAAIQGYKTAQQWNPSLPRFDPVARANELAKAAQPPKDR